MGDPTHFPRAHDLRSRRQLPRAEVEHTIQEAMFQRILSDAELQSALERSAGRPGAAVLRSILALEVGPGFTRSAAEREFLRLLAQAELPSPETGLLVAGVRPDFAWRYARLAVELDGFRGHDHRAGFARDRRRDQALLAAGWRVLRFTAAQVRDEPLAVIATVAAALVGAK